MSFLANPLDGETREELANLIKTVLGTFTTQYVKAYTLALVKKIKSEAKADDPIDYHLLSRPESKEVLKKGTLVKEGAVRKNWKQRFFVVKHDYTIDYYESEEAYNNQAQPKGTISPCGYSVNDDLDNTILERIKTLAKAMSMEVDGIPAPKKYPENTFEVYHSRRRSFYITARDPEEKESWVKMFKECCRRNYGLTDREIVHETAFRVAIRKTRWELGRWGWWSYGGSEVQIISDLISDEIDYAIMGKIYGRITGGWRVRRTIRDKVLKAIDTMVSSGVAPAWKAMKTTVDKARPTVEEKMKTMLDPLFSAQDDIVNKMKDGVMEKIKPVLETKVAPKFSKVIDILTGPMQRAFTELIKIYEEKVDEFMQKMVPGGGDNAELFKNLASAVRSWWELRAAFKEVDAMYEPLWLLRELFSDIYPWSLIWKAYDQLRNILSNAFYTFEQAVDKASAENTGDLASDVKRAREETLTKMKHDCKLATGIYFKDIVLTLVMPPFEEEVIPACKVVIEPLASLVPESLSEFIDLNEMLEDLITGIVTDSVSAVVDPTIEKIEF